jgi:hypothetical protein
MKREVIMAAITYKEGLDLGRYEGREEARKRGYEIQENQDGTAELSVPIEDVTVFNLGASPEEQAYAEGKTAGYREGWNACAAKQRLPLFEAARKWAYEHSAQIASFTRFLDADNAGLFAEIQAEYPDEKLIRPDRQLIFDAVKRDLKRRESLADKTVELSAGRKQEMSRTVKDFAEIVVS